MLKIIEIFVCEKKTSKVTFKCITFMKKDKNVHRYAVRGEKRERERKRLLKDSVKKITNLALLIKVT